MNKIKVIDLLNMISKGEEVPKKIKYKGHIYQYQYKDTKEANIINYYHSEETHHHLIDGGYHDIRLNDEVEILEEKKIPERVPDAEVFDVPKLNNMKLSNIALTNKEDIKIIKDTLNEVIDYLKSKGDE